LVNFPLTHLTFSMHKIHAEKSAPATSPVPVCTSTRGQVAVGLLFIITATLIAYSGIYKNGFVDFDDNIYITGNTHIKQGLSRDAAAWAFTSFYAYNWHPLTWLSHQLDVTLFGLAPAGHHAVGLLLHVLAALLLFGFLRSVTGTLWASVFVAALFALHPLHVESVAWASERKNVLSAFFWFATLGAYACYAKKTGAGRYGVMLALFALGLMAKPMLVTLPIVLVLLDYWPLERFTYGFKSLPRLLIEKLPLFALALASSIPTIIAQKEAIITLVKVSPGERLINAIVSYGVYLLQTIWPARLAVFYPFPPHPQVFPAIALLCFLVVLTLVVLRYGKRHPYLVTGWFWYLITLIPVIGIVQVGGQAHADRYTYIPLIGIFIIIAWSIRTAALRLRNDQNRLISAAVVLLLLLLAGKTFYQVQIWKNDESLFIHAQTVTRNNYVALNNLGLYYDQTGRQDKALELFKAALTIKPDFAETQSNLGDLLRRTGHADEAMTYYRKALVINPHLAIVHINLGIELAKTGKTDEAVEHYLKAIELDKENAAPYYNLGNLLAGTGRFDEAASYFRKACALAPDSCEFHNNLGIMLVRTGHVDEAISEYRQALKLKPDYADAYNNLGILFTVINRTDEAIAAYRKSLALDPKNGSSYNNLGYVLLHAGKVQEASDLFRKAIQLVPGDSRIIINFADALARQGDTAEAVRLLKRNLSLAKSAGNKQQTADIIKKMKEWSKNMTAVPAGQPIVKP
jgi:protein O-mannosyl-transferase